MKKNNKSVLSLFSLFLLITIACNLSTGPAATEAPVDIATQPPTATAEPAVQHVMTPPAALPSVQSGLAGDYDSSTTASKRRAPGGDRFTFDRFERPFNSTSMDVYYPGLDIQNSIFYQDSTWMYGVIALKNFDASQNLAGKYGFEIDLNVDGGGDLLVMTTQPASTEWTTDGVQVWFDSNDDVGGSLLGLTDKQPVPEDGYETQLFGNGQGDDPDLAWARISPDDPTIVQIAAKLSLLKGDTTFLVGMWAGADDFNPALFDLNDHFTHEQAGTSLPELEYYYPIKELSELDNACRMAIGFQPRGDEPGLCEQPSSPGPTGCQLNDQICEARGFGYYFWEPTCECRWLG
jgi:hypothetical protein